MGIATTAEVKALLGITATTWDTLFGLWAKIVKDDILEICNDYFRDELITMEANTIAFLENSPSADTITDSDSAFVTTGFLNGHDILIEGSLYNDGVYQIGTVAAGTLTLETDEGLNDEEAGEYVTITRIKWPRRIQKPYAQMLWWNIKNIKTFGADNQSLSRHSITYEKRINGYPESIIKTLPRRVHTA